MRRVYLLSIIVIVFGQSCSLPPQDRILISTVNTLLGDKSFVWKFGHAPNEASSEQLRISTHLEYVEQLLRNKNSDEWCPTQLKNRTKLLDLLHDYRMAGRFPKNYDMEGRKPCFIDRDTNICAVGYLLAETSGMETAQAINNKYQYALIEDMDSQELIDWAGENGLTLEECAMIQPQYWNTGPVGNEVAFATAGLSGLNGGLSLLAASGANAKNTSFVLPACLLVSSSTQLALGLINMSSSGALNKDFGLTYVNTSLRNIGMINVGVGLGSMVISGVTGYRTFKNRKLENTQMSLFSFPSENKMNVGFTLAHTF